MPSPSPKELATQLTRDLELDVPPVHISYLEQPPKGARAHPGGVPSGCTFWADARSASFYAPLSEHESCEIGAFVMGAPAEGELGQRLMATVGMMEGLGYLGKGEAFGIPHNPKAPKFVHYGPLADAPSVPTVVILFANPANAMVAMEAASPGKGAPFDVPVSGRPACSVVPTVLHGKSPVAMSLGCAGFRQFTEVGKDKVLIAVRGDQLGAFAEAVHKLRSANQAVDSEMARRKSPTKGRSRPK